MTKAEQTRLIAWRLRVLRHAAKRPRSIAETCGHFGISRPTIYKWKARFEEGQAAGLVIGRARPSGPHGPSSRRS